MKRTRDISDIFTVYDLWHIVLEREVILDQYNRYTYMRISLYKIVVICNIICMARLSNLFHFSLSRYVNLIYNMVSARKFCCNFGIYIGTGWG